MNNKVWIVSLLVMASGLAISQAQIAAQGLGFVAPTIIDKSQVYEPTTGEIVYESGSSTFWGRTATSWIGFAAASSTTPVGAVMAFAGATCPTGYLAADGGRKSQAEYTDLYNVLLDIYGPDTDSQFYLPDYRGQFLRGVSGDSNMDPDKNDRDPMRSGATGDNNNVGSVQADAFASHYHVQGFATANPGSGAASGRYGSEITAINNGAGEADTPFSANSQAGAKTSNQGGAETRPKNVYVNFCIKY